MMMKQLLTFVFLSFMAKAAVGQTQLPSFSLKDFKSGETVTAESLKGKVLYVDFWASWCKPCRKSFPFMNELTASYDESEFQVIAINLDESEEDAAEFLQQYPASFKIYRDPSNNLAQAMNVPGLPVAYIVDKQGKVRATHTGFKEKKTQKKIDQINALLSVQ
jgi:thiol-disulfide isomerase/thioredoxin